MRGIILAITVLCWAQDGLSEEVGQRTFRDRTGKFTVEAEFIELWEGVVGLRKKSGERIFVPLERLSPGDKAWIVSDGSKLSYVARLRKKRDKQVAEAAEAFSSLLNNLATRAIEGGNSSLSMGYRFLLSHFKESGRIPETNYLPARKGFEAYTDAKSRADDALAEEIKWLVGHYKKTGRSKEVAMLKAELEGATSPDDRTPPLDRFVKDVRDLVKKQESFNGTSVQKQQYWAEEYRKIQDKHRVVSVRVRVRDVQGANGDYTITIEPHDELTEISLAESFPCRLTKAMAASILVDDVIVIEGIPSNTYNFNAVLIGTMRGLTPGRLYLERSRISKP